jgi:hypothetical protein
LPRHLKIYLEKSAPIVARRARRYPMRINNNKKETTLMATITVGRRLIPLEQIALFQPFDESARGNMQSARPFQARILLLNRDSVLTEETPVALGTQNGFRVLSEDGIATNPAVLFSVEAFEAVGDFKPQKPYRSRLLWRDQAGQIQSILLLSFPEDVLATAIRGIGVAPSAKPPRARRARRQTGAPEPA